MALNLVIAAIVYWNTSYMDKASEHLRRQGRLPDPNLLRHVSPLGWDHIVLTGDYDWNSGAGQDPCVAPSLGSALSVILRTNLPMTP